MAELQNRVARLTTVEGDVCYAWQSDCERFDGDLARMDEETVLYRHGMSGWDDLRGYFEGRATCGRS